MLKAIRRYGVLFLIAAVAAAGLCALSYITILNYSYENRENAYSLSNDGLIEDLETSLRYGKTLDNYFGLSEDLARSQSLLEGDCEQVIVGNDGTVYAATFPEQSRSISLSEYGELVQDIHGPEGDTVGQLRTYYPKDQVIGQIQSSSVHAIVCSAGLLVLILIVCLALGIKNQWAVTKLTPFIVVGILVQGIVLTVIYTPEFDRAARSNVESIANTVTSSVQSLLDKGVKFEEISDLDEYLQGKITESPSIQNIFVTEEPPENASNLYIHTFEHTDHQICFVFDVSESYIRLNIVQMVLTFSATIILAIIFMMESLPLAEMIAFRRNKNFAQPCPEQYAFIAKNIRYTNFLSVTFDYMCLSFSALMIKDWNQGFWNVSPEMAAALSISICSVADILGMLSTPVIGKRVSSKTLMLASSFILIGANLLCFTTTSTLVVILTRFLSGMGTAGVKQLRNRIIASGYSNEGERNAVLAGSNNGVIGGILCGMGLGGVVAGVFGYSATFLAAGVGSVLYLAFTWFCLPWKLLQSHAPADSLDPEQQSSFVRRLLHVLASRKVWKTILCVAAPQYLLLMVIVYLIPGRIQSGNMPGVVLTYANLINGMVGLYLGEHIYNLLIRKTNRPTRVQAIVLVAGAVSMAVLNLPFLTVVFCLLSAALSGVVDGAGTPVTTDIFMGNAVIMMNLDDTESLMLYSMLGSLVTAISPFILELCEKSSVWMYAVCALLVAIAVYLVLGERGRPQKARKAAH